MPQLSRAQQFKRRLDAYFYAERKKRIRKRLVSMARIFGEEKFKTLDAKSVCVRSWRSKIGLLTRWRHDTVHAEILDQLSIMIGDVPHGSSHCRQSVVAPICSLERLK